GTAGPAGMMRRIVHCVSRNRRRWMREPDVWCVARPRVDYLLDYRLAHLRSRKAARFGPRGGRDDPRLPPGNGGLQGRRGGEGRQGRRDQQGVASFQIAGRLLPLPLRGILMVALTGNPRRKVYVETQDPSKLRRSERHLRLRQYLDDRLYAPGHPCGSVL